MSVHTSDVELESGVASGARVLFADDHHKIEEARRALLACAHEGCPRTLIERYRTFERAVLEHLQAEEAVLLPSYALHAPADARAIRDEHAAIRKELFRIGVEVELHSTRLVTLQSLIDTMREHAACEDRSMYPWAQVHLPLSTKRGLPTRTDRSIRELAELRARSAATAQPACP